MFRATAHAASATRSGPRPNLVGVTATPLPGRRPDRDRLPVAVAGVLAAGGLAVLALAVTRFLTHAGGPVLPYALCRAGADVFQVAPLTPGRLLTEWQADPVALALLAGVAAVYLRGARRAADWPGWRTAAYLGGLGVVALAVTSSIAVYDMTQFWAHMVQHLMLIMLAPALIVAGRPLTLLVAASAEPQRRRVLRVLASRPLVALTSPAVALAAYAVVIVGAHLTGLSDLVMSRPWAGQVEHLIYLAVGVLFFSLIFGDEPIRWRLSMPGRLMLLVISMAVDTFVGLVLLQTTHPISMIAHPGWGLAPLADTQAGGAVMWVGGDGLMAAMAIVLFLSWARRPEATRRQVSFFERARFGLQSERDTPLAPGPAATEPGTARAAGPVGAANMDEDEEQLAAYNRWLAQLGRRG